MQSARWLSPVLFVACCAWGCSSDESGTGADSSSIGGAQSSGGATSSVSSMGAGGNTGTTNSTGTQNVAGNINVSTQSSVAGSPNLTLGGNTGISTSSSVAAGAAPVGGAANGMGGASDGGISNSASMAAIGGDGGAPASAGGAAAQAGESSANVAAGATFATGGAVAQAGTSSSGIAGAAAGAGGAGTGGQTNRPNVACGNGVVEPGEDCDDGNSREDDGCTASCRYGCNTVKDCDDHNPCTAESCGPTLRGFACAYETLAGSACDDGDGCTPSDTCDSSAACRGQSSTCNCSVDQDCVAREDGNACNGTLRCISGKCEVNPASVITCDTSGNTVCRKSECNPATGVCSLVNATDGTACDDGLFCTSFDSCIGGTCVGSSDPCQSYSCTAGCDETNRRCAPVSPGMICRGAGGACDLTETCNGVSVDCPPDVRLPLGAVCRSASGECDMTEQCNGISVNCPDDALKPFGLLCRAAVGICDAAESCDGVTRDCPPNGFVGAGNVCRAKAGECDVPESCTGFSGDCPPDNLMDASVVCRPASGACDVGESCTGATPNCPTDTVASVGAVCRTAASICDITEVCDGATPNCPSNAFLPAGTACNDGQACTVQDSCNATGQCSVFASLAPPMPKLLWPTNGWLTGSAKGAPNGSMSLRPMLRWDAAGSDGCGVVNYEIQLDDSCGLSTLKTCNFPSPEVDVSGVTVTSWRSDVDLAVHSSAPVGSSYAWRVRACRNGACSGWTNPRYLNVGRAPNDFNGDGYSDLAIGAPEATNDGRVLLYYGSALGIVAAEGTTLLPGNLQAGQAFGSALAAGDFDGDGYADLAVGAPLWDEGTDADVGHVSLYRGSIAGLESAPGLVLEALSPEVGAQFGAAVSLEGDIDADGKDDLAIGEPLRNTVQVDEGAVSIHFGHVLSTADVESFVIGTPYPTANANFGSVLTLGDVNGDGSPDLVAGALSSRRGAVVFLGATGLLPIPAPIDLATGGNAVAANGDTDGSGRVNLMLGMNNNMWHGWLCDGSYFYTYDGTATGITGTGNPSRGCDYGYGLGNGGDFDGDGLFDSVASSIKEGPGMVVLFHGLQGTSNTVWYEIWNPGNVTGGQFGYSLGTRGDFDADGRADLVVGAPEQNAVYVFQGKSSGPAVEPSVVLNGAGKLGRATPR